MITEHHPNPQKPHRVVVLGAGGFVGKALIALLNRERTERLPVSSAEIDLTHSSAEGRLRQLLKPEDVLVFCSAITPDKGKDIRSLMKNLLMGEHVCAALSKASCAQVIYISSDAVYPDGETPIRESTPSNPSSFHGLMHLVRERMLQATLSPLGIVSLCLRPTGLYGPKDTHNSYGPNRFVRAACRGDKITLFGYGEEQRDHLYVEDLARLISLCASHRVAGCLNVAAGRSVSFNDLARMVASLTKQNIEIEFTPRNNPISHRYFDITALVRSFPALQPTPLETGLSKMHQEVLGQSEA